MTALFTHWNRRVRFTGGAGTPSSSHYSATNFIAAGTEVEPGGPPKGDFTTPGPAWQGDAWGFSTGASADDVRGDPPGASQFGSLVIEDAVTFQQPNIGLRLNPGSSDGFICGPWAHLGGAEIAEFTAGVYTMIAFGGAGTDVVGTKLTGTASPPDAGLSVLAVWYDDVAQASILSLLHTSGDVGIVGTGNIAGPAFSDFRVGNLALLDDVEIEESTGFPIVLSANKLSGIFESETLEGPGGGCDWWSVLVEVHEEEVGHLVGDMDYAVGSGEGRWRGVYTREATEAYPGADFDWLVGDATKNVEDNDLRVCGLRGMHGRNTRAKVWTAFRVGGVWGPWIEGAWVGERGAEAMKIKVELDRVTLDYQIRITRALLAVAS